MTVEQIYHDLLWFLFGFSALTLVASFFYTTPYGRFKKPDERFEIASLLGWLVMEFPCLVVCLVTFFSTGGNSTALVPGDWPGWSRTSSTRIATSTRHFSQ